MRNDRRGLGSDVLGYIFLDLHFYSGVVWRGREGYFLYIRIVKIAPICSERSLFAVACLSIRDALFHLGWCECFNTEVVGLQWAIRSMP